MTQAKPVVFRSFRRVQRRMRAEQDAHAVVVQVQTKDVPEFAASWWSDARRGKLRVLSGAFRTVDVLKAQGRTDLAVMLGEVLIAYARDEDSAA